METKTFDADELKIKLPSATIVFGPSSSGKTTLTLKIMKHAKELFTPVPEQIVYAYGQYHPYVPVLQGMGITVHAGVPTEEFLDGCQRPLLLVMDDLQLYTSERYLSELFTKKSHHQQIGVVFLCQNLIKN
jgi:hypothetical protein